MPNLTIVNFNIVCATLGGFITLFGLVSYLLKEKFYLGEALISTYAGLLFSPHAANFIKPLQFAQNSQENLETITLYYSRLVLDVQLVIAGVQLPSKYLQTEWKSLSLLLGPGMCAMWVCTSLLIWALVPDITFLAALAIGACVTPTDPVLSNSIVKGKFADKNIPSALQKIIIAESGANDGLGYPFLFLALYLIKYTDPSHHGISQSGGAREAMALWFGETWGWTILLSVVYGAVVGWLAKELLHWAEERHYVDRESFLVFAVALALFIAGTVGLLGSDDVLASFIAGNVFTWDDWFRLETQDDSLQPTIDMLLNVSIFMWFGAVCPWHSFVSNSIIPIYRLIPLGILVLLFRRLPMVLAYHYFGWIHQIEDIRHAFFVGFFGPIGVSAIFYVYITREFLRDLLPRPDAQVVDEGVEVIVWFLVICSITVHGLSIPLGKLGFYLPRTLSTAISSERVSASQSRARESEDEGGHPFTSQRSDDGHLRPLRRRATSSEVGPILSPSRSLSLLPRSFVRAGRHVWNDIRRPHGTTAQDVRAGKAEPLGSGARQGSIQPGVIISGPMDARPIGHAIQESSSSSAARDDECAAERSRHLTVQSQVGSASSSVVNSGANTPIGARQLRSIQFADERGEVSRARSPVPAAAAAKTID